MSNQPSPFRPEPLTRRVWRLPGPADRAISVAVIDTDNEETRRTKRLLAGALWISFLTAGASIWQFLASDANLAALALGATAVVALVSLLLMWRWPSTYPDVMHFIATGTIMVSAAITLMYGGFLESGANSIWGFVAVLGTIVIFEDWRAVLWLTLFSVTVVVVELGTARLEPIYELPNPAQSAIFNLLVTMAFIFTLLFYYARQRAALLQQTDALLRNVLPDRVAGRLKKSTEMIADEFEAASILFADVEGFTSMSARMGPGELVNLLNDVFSEFDKLVEAGGLEKIKTIGDAYMVAAGVPVPRPDHAEAICDLGLAMQHLVDERQFNHHKLPLRIGINSGPVVAGIIGRQKFSYDLWGDAVNVASRMETTGVAGRIQITENTRSLIDRAFTTERGGTVNVKGKGPMEVWYLLGRIEER